MPRTSLPLLTPSSLTRYFSSSFTAAFIHSADFRTNGRINSPAPNLSPTSFIAGSRSSFKVCIAPGCVIAFSALRDSFPLLSTTSTEIFSAIAETTSFSIPSFNLLIILKFDFFPADHEGSI